MKSSLDLFAVYFVLTVAASFAGDPAPGELDSRIRPQSSEEEQCRNAIRKSVVCALPYLERDGVAWMNDRNCLSCHHVPFLLWTHRFAKARGIQTDEQKLEQWNQWAERDSLAHRYQFKLTKNQFDSFDAASSIFDIKDKIKPIVDQPYLSEADFIARLSEFLTEDELKVHQTKLVAASMLSVYSSEHNGGGLDALAQLVIGDERKSKSVAAQQFREGLFDLIRQMQLEDGSWTPGIQFATMRQWSLSEANRVTTMWAAIALAADESAGDSHLKQFGRVISFLDQPFDKSLNREFQAVQMVFANRFGRAPEGARALLTTAQNPDGGWGWNENRDSDPYTTGIVLYALVQDGKRRSIHLESESVARAAINYLLAAQQDDGSWLTASKRISNTSDPERLKARDEIYHYWGTAWSVLGLLQTLPDADFVQ